jgi:hypothetical protein
MRTVLCPNSLCLDHYPQTNLTLQRKTFNGDYLDLGVADVEKRLKFDEQLQVSSSMRAVLNLAAELGIKIHPRIEARRSGYDADFFETEEGKRHWPFVMEVCNAAIARFGGTGECKRMKELVCYDWLLSNQIKPKSMLDKTLLLVSKLGVRAQDDEVFRTCMAILHTVLPSREEVGVYLKDARDDAENENVSVFRKQGHGQYARFNAKQDIETVLSGKSLPKWKSSSHISPAAFAGFEMFCCNSGSLEWIRVGKVKRRMWLSSKRN